jgi:pimeloyl-ACP methyl ester carboxylesterase
MRALLVGSARVAMASMGLMALGALPGCATRPAVTPAAEVATAEEHAATAAAVPELVMAPSARRAGLATAGLRAEMIAAPGGPLRVYAGGSGPTVVLVHGTAAHAGDWYRVVPALADRFTLLVPDLPGHGESAPAQGPLPVSDLAAGLGALLDAKSPGAKVTLVGNSLGGWACLLYAATHPERVERVVGLSSSGIFARLPVSLRPANREEARQLVLAVRGPSAPQASDAELDALVAASSGAADGPAARVFAGLRAEDFLERRADAIRVPVDLLWGDEDGLLVPDYGRRLAALLPDARLRLLPRCGHMPQLWCPETLLPVLLETLSAPRQEAARR